MALELTQRFRRQVSPYNVIQSLAVLSGSNYCPAIQSISTDGTPDISREGDGGVPTVIQAEVSAVAADGSGRVSAVTDSAVTNIKWMVQRGDETAGTDITLHAAWTGKFEIGTSADKGKLFVKMNVSSGVTWKIWMECVIADQRRGYTMPIDVITDSVVIYSVADAAEQYTMSIDRPSAEVYELARDQRLIHEYLVGQGVEHTLADDGQTYIRTVSAVLRAGGTMVQTSDYSIKVFSIGALGNRTEVTADTDECVSSISANTVTFDLRFAEGKTYQIACFVDGSEVAHKTYGWAWSGEMPSTDEGLVGASTYGDNTIQTYRPKLNFGKGVLQYPCVAYEMRWYWRNPQMQPTKTYVGCGDQQTYDLSVSAMFYGGVSDAVLEIDKRGAFRHLTDDGTNRLVDENGNYLIVN